MNDSRQTSYEAVGANSASGTIEVQNNNSEVLELFGVMADGSDEIAINVMAGAQNTNANGFFYINALMIETRPKDGVRVSEPAGLGAIGLGLLVASTFIGRRRKA